MKKENYKSIITDFPDLICISGLDFFIMVIGTWALPQMPEKVHLYFALAILLSAIYFTKHIVYFIVNEYLKKEKDKKWKKILYKTH